MNTDNIFLKGSPKYVDRNDLADFLTNHLNTYMYNQIATEKINNINPDKAFNNNIDFWQSSLNGDCFPEQIIKLQEFHIIEWIPIAPGLFHTSDAHWNRTEAQRNAVRILERNSVGPMWQSTLGPKTDIQHNPIFKKTLEELKKNPKKRVVIEYNPDGKESMIKGGIGSLRLASKLVNGKECYLLGASSTGVSHEGIPIMLDTILYQQAISKIKDNGGFVVNLTGRLKVLSKELSVIKSYREIPRFCLFIENIEYLRPSKSIELMASVAVSYYPTNSFSEKRLSFCSFIPDKKDNQLVEAVDWLNEYAVKYSQSKSPIVEGDFDEFKAHFDSVDFPIVDVSNGKMSKETFMRYKQFFHLEVNELIMGDKFENISNSTVINRSKNVAINPTKSDNPSDTISDVSEIKKDFQELVSNGQIEETLEKLLEFFKNKGNKYALNEAIMYNSQFSQLKAQENYNTISHDDASRENARITKAIIDFIQRVL